MAQTAVDWIVDKLVSDRDKLLWHEYIEQAKQMEKEQIEKAKEEGYDLATSEAIKEIHKNYKPI